MRAFPPDLALELADTCLSPGADKIARRKRKAGGQTAGLSQHPCKAAEGEEAALRSPSRKGWGDEPGLGSDAVRRLEESHRKPAALSADASKSMRPSVAKRSAAIARSWPLLRRTGGVCVGNAPQPVLATTRDLAQHLQREHG